jgi:hypothetical protein
MATYIHQINGLPIAASEAVPGSPLADALDAISAGAFRIAQLTTGENPVPDVPIPSPKIIYLTKDESSTATDPYTEWIWTQGDPTVTPPTSDKWVIIGTTSIALEDLDSTVDSGQDNHIEIEIVETNGKLASVTVVRDDTETVDNKIAAWGTPTDTQYPSAKLTKDTLDTKADKVTVPAGSDPSGHIPELDEHGNLEDSGIEAANLVTDVTVNSESVVDRQTKTAVIPTAAPGANGAPGNYGVVTIATMEI